jgi:hypothetical protein
VTDEEYHDNTGDWPVSGDEKQVAFKLIWLDHVMMSELSSSAKLVVHTLARFMSADGTEAFPAVSKIVRLSGLGEKTARRALDELRGKRWLRVTERTRQGRQLSNSYDALLPPSIANDGTSPLHDAEKWEVHYAQQQEKNRRRKRRQRGHTDDSCTPVSLGAYTESEASCLDFASPPESSPMYPCQIDSVPLSDYRYVPLSDWRTEDALSEDALKDTPLGETGKMGKTAPKEIAWGGVEDELSLAAQLWRTHLYCEVGVPAEEVEDYPDLTAKFRANYSELIAQSEKEHWPEGRLSDEIYAALTA